MIIRLSDKLNVKIKAGRLPAVPLDENPFADWSAHLFTADRAQYILVTNTRSLYSTVLFGRGITDDSQFIDAVLRSLRDFMQADGQEFIFRRLIAPAAREVRFAKALDRSVIGSMNDLVKVAAHYLADGETSPFDLGFKLNDMPMSATARQFPGTNGFARKAFKAMTIESES